MRRDLVIRRFATPGSELHAGLLPKPGPEEDLHDCSEDTYTAVWLLQGGGFYQDLRGRIAVTAGDLVQRLPGVRHSTWGDGRRDWCEMFLTIPGTVFSALAAVGALDGRRPVLRPGSDAGLLEDGRRLIADLHRAGEGEWPALCARAVALVAALHERHRHRAAGDRDGLLVAEACRLLAADPARPAAAAAVAQRLGLSYERFRKVFATRVGLAPAAYQRRRRIEAACAMLLDGRPAVGEVSRRLGFPDVYAFTRIFIREMGTPPGRWSRRLV